MQWIDSIKQAREKCKGEAAREQRCSPRPEHSTEGDLTQGSGHCLTRQMRHPSSFWRAMEARNQTRVNVISLSWNQPMRMPAIARDSGAHKVPPSPVGPLNLPVPDVNYGMWCNRAKNICCRQRCPGRQGLRQPSSASGCWYERLMGISSGSGGLEVGEPSFVPATGTKFGAVFTCNTTKF